MRDTNHQLHPRDMKSMTHISKWVLTVHTKSRTEYPAQQVIPDGPGMVSHDLQYTIHRIQILLPGSTKLHGRVMISITTLNHSLVQWSFHKQTHQGLLRS